METALQWLTNANSGELAGLSTSLFLFLAILIKVLSRPSKVDQKIEQSKTQTTATEVKEVVETIEEPKVETVSWSERLNKGLAQTRQQVWGKIGNILGGKALSSELLEEIEELLYSADLGPTVVADLVEALEEKMKTQSFEGEEFKSFLYNFLKQKLGDVQANSPEQLFSFKPGQAMQTIMIVGVNGAGKTTTIGKLATRLTRQGAKVVVGACDTFRAAAVDQLQVWCDRAGAEMVRAKEGSNPSGVGFEALKKAQELGADYCLLDTAGRLHTKSNLMDELAKSKRVLTKLDEKAPQHVLLVIDAITGQNAINQAQEFHKSLNLSGLIFTKCDGSSKAGSAVGIVNKLQVPISYIGVGESVEDLDEFDLDQYLGALLDYKTSGSTENLVRS